MGVNRSQHCPYFWLIAIQSQNRFFALFHKLLKQSTLAYLSCTCQQDCLPAKQPFLYHLLKGSLHQFHSIHHFGCKGSKKKP